MSLTITPSLKSYYEVNSNVTLTCYVTAPTSSLININITLNVIWMSHKNDSATFSANNFINFFNQNINNSKLSDAGEYSCTYYLTSTTDNPYIKQSIPVTKVTNITIKSK